MPAQKPSCVVLGGGGFIGINLCRRFVAPGHRVRAFGRHCRFPDDLRGVEWCQGDFSDPDSVAAAIQTFDIERLIDAKLRIKWAPGRMIDIPTSVVAIDSCASRTGMDVQDILRGRACDDVRMDSPKSA